MDGATAGACAQEIDAIVSDEKQRELIWEVTELAQTAPWWAGLHGLHPLQSLRGGTRTAVFKHCDEEIDVDKNFPALLGVVRRELSRRWEGDAETAITAVKACLKCLMGDFVAGMDDFMRMMKARARAAPVVCCVGCVGVVVVCEDVWVLRGGG